MPITKRPCSNCPFRCDGAAIELRPGRIEGIIKGLLADDFLTFTCQDRGFRAHDLRRSGRGHG